MKKSLFLIVSLLVAGLIVYFGVHAVAAKPVTTKATGSSSCKPTGVTHFVTIQNGQAIPNDIIAKLCDTLTITNKDAQVRLLAFGEHENHQAYDGVLERTLDKDQGLTVTLNQAGSFKFHDHLDDSAQGTFTVIN